MFNTFISHDTETNAEVKVTTFTDFKVSKVIMSGSNATVSLVGDNLKFPDSGKISESDAELIALAQSLEGTDTPVSGRIETQRKRNIDPTLPLSALTSTTDTVRKLVELQGVRSSEYATDPSQDPTGRRRTANPANTASKPQPQQGGATQSQNRPQYLSLLNQLAKTPLLNESVVDVIKALALINGATPDDVNRAYSSEAPAQAPANTKVRAVEAPAYKTHNSDGHLNLGSYSVSSTNQTITAVEALLLEQHKIRPTDDALFTFVEQVIRIADVLQTFSYRSAHPDRQANSHSVIRYTALHVIRHLHPFPALNADGDIADPATIPAWVKEVGTATQARYSASINLSTKLELKDPATFTAEEKPATKTKQSSSKQKTEQKTQVAEKATPQPEETKATEPTPVEAVVAPHTPAKRATSKKNATLAEEKPAEEALFAQPLPEGLQIYPQQHLPNGFLTADNVATKETVDLFKQFVNDSVPESELGKVSKLLAWTFGKNYNRATNLPEDVLGDFMDFYAAVGPEEFAKAVQYVGNL